MLKIDNIHVYYGAIHAIKGVSFEVNDGEIVALIGANGAGKSTILKTVSGLMHPRSGSISFMDQDITHMDAYKLVRHGLAHVPEGRRIFLQMSVQENLDMGAFTQNGVSKEDLDMVFQLFPRLKERSCQEERERSQGLLTEWAAASFRHTDCATLATTRRQYFQNTVTTEHTESRSCEARALTSLPRVITRQRR